MASQFDIHSCSMPQPGACVQNDSSDNTSTDGDTEHTAPCDAFQFFHEQACAPRHPLLRGFRNIVTGSPILTRLWRKYAHTHAWHTWDAVPATGAAEFIDACQMMRTQLADTQTSNTRPVFESTVGDSTPPAHARMLDVYSPNCRPMLKSFIPNAVKKSAWYRSAHAPNTFALNISKVVSVLLKKNYPSSWWRPQLLAKASTLDLCPQALFGIQLATERPP